MPDSLFVSLDGEAQARVEIADLVGRYTRAGDTGREAEFAELFAADGVFEVNGGRAAKGADEIAELMSVVKRAFAKAPADFFPARHQYRGSPSTSTTPPTPVEATSCSSPAGARTTGACTEIATSGGRVVGASPAGVP